MWQCATCAKMGSFIAQKVSVHIKCSEDSCSMCIEDVIDCEMGNNGDNLMLMHYYLLA